MSGFPEASESKTIHFPSGDHRGVPVPGPFNEVNCVCLSPSRSHTQISSFPVRLEANAMRSPDGEMLGLSSRREERISGLGAPKRPGTARALNPGPSIAYRLLSLKDSVYTRRSALRETEG